MPAEMALARAPLVCSEKLSDVADDEGNRTHQHPQKKSRQAMSNETDLASGSLGGRLPRICSGGSDPCGMWPRFPLAIGGSGWPSLRGDACPPDIGLTAGATGEGLGDGP